jgi:hypothetical protein
MNLSILMDYLYSPMQFNRLILSQMKPVGAFLAWSSTACFSFRPEVQTECIHGALRSGETN